MSTIQTYSSDQPADVAVSLYNFPVSLKPVYDEDRQEIPHFKSVTRTDSRKSLAIVSDRYRLIPHTRLVDAFQPFAAQLGEHTTRFFQEREGARLVVEKTFRGINFSVPAHRDLHGRPAVNDVVGLRLYGVNSYNTTTPLTLRVGCLVLRCLNGATAMESFFGLNIKHVGQAEPEINLPDPEAVLNSFRNTGRVWEEWADTRINRESVDHLKELGLRYGVASKRALEKEEARFNQVETIWDLHNVFTYVVSHETRKIQETSRLGRFDRLNLMINSFLKSEEISGLSDYGIMNP